ncbi:hypothetical protein GCK32_015831 [Trichostrongylus colubriformis]|uniref:Uncharacterized protein n=1 Tax=Trichostrongylus colubriformis TaxID=6319 RepID=A0AAN8IR13_TRICO
MRSFGFEFSDSQTATSTLIFIFCALGVDGRWENEGQKNLQQGPHTLQASGCGQQAFDPSMSLSQTCSDEQDIGFEGEQLKCEN